MVLLLLLHEAILIKSSFPLRSSSIPIFIVYQANEQIIKLIKSTICYKILHIK